MTPRDPSQSEAADRADDSAPLAHHFGSLRQQSDAARLGMWIFLVTEILFFGGLFCAYAVYRANRPEVFVDGHHFLSTPLGAGNTVVLIFSSLTMALAVRSAQLGRRTALVGLLGVTLLCGLAFLAVKGVEYKQKWDHRLVPGQARIASWFSGGAASPEGSAAVRDQFHPDLQYVKEHLQPAGSGHLTDAQWAQRVDNLRSFMGIAPATAPTGVCQTVTRFSGV